MAAPQDNYVQYPVTKTVGPDKMRELRYNNDAKADKKMEVLATPILVLTASQATTGFNVGIGNLCRVFGTAGSSLVQFAETIPGAVPTTTTQTAAMLSLSAQVFVATGDFIRTTSDVTRVEVYED
jgi:hypothetical protein